MTDTVRVPKAFSEAYYDAHLRHALDALRDGVPYRVNADGAYTLIQQAASDRRAVKALLAASPQGEGDWITHDGGPNPAPGKTVDWRNREGREDNCGSDELAGWGHPHEAGERYDIIAYRVTEGVKP